MFSIIGITSRVGGGAASRLPGMGKQVRAVSDEAKGHVWASKGASVAVDSFTSPMNFSVDDYSMGHILRFAREAGIGTLTIDLLTVRDSPQVC